jgi:hypothetical protein
LGTRPCPSGWWRKTPSARSQPLRCGVDRAGGRGGLGGLVGLEVGRAGLGLLEVLAGDDVRLEDGLPVDLPLPRLHGVHVHDGLDLAVDHVREGRAAVPLRAAGTEDLGPVAAVDDPLRVAGHADLDREVQALDGGDRGQDTGGGGVTVRLVLLGGHYVLLQTLAPQLLKLAG